MAPQGAHGSPLWAFQGSFSPDLRPEEAASCGEPAAEIRRREVCGFGSSVNDLSASLDLLNRLIGSDLINADVLQSSFFP